jgi:hypothetical protein
MKKSCCKLIFYVTEDWYFCLHRLPIARAARSVYHPSPEPDGGPIVVTLVARMLLDKGVVEFIKAVRLLKREFAESIVMQKTLDLYRSMPGQRWPEST